MKDLKVVFGFIRNLVIGLVIEGVLAIAVGVLIFIYPDLLNYLVAALLIIGGLLGIIFACKLNKYSKLKIKLIHRGLRLLQVAWVIPLNHDN